MTEQKSALAVSPLSVPTCCGCCGRDLPAGEEAHLVQVVGSQSDLVAWPLEEPEEYKELTAQDEEARPARKIPRPEMPSQAEIDQHRIDHIPYRAWCPECVEGFGRERAHHARGTEERSIPMVSCDYMYLSRKGAMSKDELSEEERKASVCVCARSQMQQHTVPVRTCRPPERGGR